MSHFACHMSHCACHMPYVKCLCWFLGHAEQLLFWCLCSKVSLCNYVTFCMSHVTLRMSHVICQMLMLILGTCWTTFVLMSMLKSEYLWLCHISHFACHMSQCACHMSYVKCLCWSLGHAEQFLFSCLCSNVAVYGWKRQCFFFDRFFDRHFFDTLTCEWTNHRAGSQLKKTGFCNGGMCYKYKMSNVFDNSWKP